MSDAEDRYQATLAQLNDVLAAAQAEHDRLRADAETAEASVDAFTNTLAAAVDNLHAALPQPAAAE